MPAAAAAGAAAPPSPSAAPAPSLRVERRLDPAQWDRFVERHPDATVYHLSAWTDLIADVFGHRAERLAAVGGDEGGPGDISGILPLAFFNTRLFGRFATSMPFVNYGGVAADSPAAARLLFNAAASAAQAAGASYLELRHARRMFDGSPHLAHKVAMILPLRQTADEQWTALDRKLRNQVRKAEKSGLTVRSGGVELAGAFHDVLSENMRDLGTPAHGRGFYERILETFPDRSRVLVVLLGGQPIAASLLLWHRQRLEVPWASSIRRFNPLCANVLLYWEMLKFGIDRGFTSFDFGRSTPNEGTFLFKQQWGAQPLQLYWEYWLAAGVALPDRSPKNPKFGSAVALWQRLPVALTRMIGPRVVRNIP
jgi:FemAB-related protein (PEP-CTERM system-associated)